MTWCLVKAEGQLYLYLYVRERNNFATVQFVEIEAFTGCYGMA